VRGLNLAVEFTGGMLIQVHQALAAKSVEDTFVRAGLAETSMKDFNEFCF